MVNGVVKLFVFLVKQVRETVKKSFFAFKIVIKGSFGSLGSCDNVLNGGVLVTIFIKQIPCGFHDAAFCGLSFSWHRMHHSFQVFIKREADYSKSASVILCKLIKDQ